MNRLNLECQETCAIFYKPVKVPWSDIDRITLESIGVWMASHGWTQLADPKWRRWWHRHEDTDVTIQAPTVLSSELGTSRVTEVPSFYSEIARSMTASFIDRVADWHGIHIHDVVQGLVSKEGEQNSHG